MPSHYLAHGLGKLQPKIQNPGGNELRRLRLDLGYNAIQQRLTISVFCPFQTAISSQFVNASQLRLQTLSKKHKTSFKSQTFKDLNLLTSCKLGTPLLCAYFFRFLTNDRAPLHRLVTTVVGDDFLTLAFKVITCATAVAKMLTLIRNTLHSLLQLILTSRQLPQQFLRTALPAHLPNLLALTLRTKMSYLSTPSTKRGEMFLRVTLPLPIIQCPCFI